MGIVVSWCQVGVGIVVSIVVSWCLVESLTPAGISLSLVNTHIFPPHTTASSAPLNLYPLSTAKHPETLAAQHRLTAE